MAPIFSIIIPVYKVEKYIDECITSVINQSFGDFEAICVDDCGEDKSVEIIQKYAKKDSRIKVLKHDKNRGLSAARNTALKASTGKYIVCLDSDDWLEKDCLKILLEEFQSKQVECVLFDGYKYDDRNQVRMLDKICNNKSGYLEVTPNNICNITDYSWIKAYTRRSIVDNDIWWPEGLTFEDGEFHMEYFALTNKIYVSDACLINYRIREGSIVTVARTGNVHLDHIYQIVKNVRKFYIARGLYKKYKQAVLELCAKRINTCRQVAKNYEKSIPMSNQIIKDFGFPQEFAEYKNDNPEVSVVIPFYNVEKYVEQCIQSVQGQSFNDIEIICVDDCGHDGTRKIVEKLAQQDKRIKIITHDKNRGLGGARNTGLREAKGKYVFFVDSDDYITPDCVETVIEKFKQKHVDTVWFKANIWWEEINKMTDMWIFKYYADYPQGPLTLNDDNLIEFPLYSWNKAYKRDFLIKNKLDWRENVYFEDVEFYFKTFTKSKDIYIINKPLYVYRRRSDSIIGECIKDARKAEHLFNVTENVYKYLTENNLFEEYKNSFYRYACDTVKMFRSYPNTQKKLYPRIQKFLEKINVK